MKPDLASYDYVIVAFSGGKDSLACLLHLLELGVPRERVELWHHEVDGRGTGRAWGKPLIPWIQGPPQKKPRPASIIVARQSA